MIESFIATREAAQEANEVALDEETRQAIRGNTPKIDSISPQQLDRISGPGQVWPLVRFANDRTLLCNPAEFSIENAFGKAEAIRVQVPLILAWALSIHKSQGLSDVRVTFSFARIEDLKGQTIERVKVDLSKTFEKGQGKPI